MGMLSEFREFAVKGNVVDLAVGVIIGGAFGKIVDSMVKDLIMPLVGKVVGGLDFSNYFVVLGNVPADFKGPQTYEALTKAGVPLFAYGSFLTVLLNFIILAFIIFMMVKQINRLKRSEPAPRAGRRARDARGHRPAARDPRLAQALIQAPRVDPAGGVGGMKHGGCEARNSMQSDARSALGHNMRAQIHGYLAHAARPHEACAPFPCP